MNGVYEALNTAVATSTYMVGQLAGKGATIALATISAAVVIGFIYLGFRKGWAAMQGKTYYEDVMGTRWKTREKMEESNRMIDSMGL